MGQVLLILQSQMKNKNTLETILNIYKVIKCILSLRVVKNKLSRKEEKPNVSIVLSTVRVQFHKEVLNNAKRQRFFYGSSLTN